MRAGLEGSRRIDRKDWGVTWNTKLDSGGVLVSDKITLEFELSLIKNVAEAAPADSSKTTDENEAPAEAPEPATEATPAPEADSAAPQPRSSGVGDPDPGSRRDRDCSSRAEGPGERSISGPEGRVRRLGVPSPAAGQARRTFR